MKSYFLKLAVLCIWSRTLSSCFEAIELTPNKRTIELSINAQDLESLKTLITGKTEYLLGSMDIGTYKVLISPVKYATNYKIKGLIDNVLKNLNYDINDRGIEVVISVQSSKEMPIYLEYSFNSNNSNIETFNKTISFSNLNELIDSNLEITNFIVKTDNFDGDLLLLRKNPRIESFRIDQRNKKAYFEIDDNNQANEINEVAKAEEYRHNGDHKKKLNNEYFAVEFVPKPPRKLAVKLQSQGDISSIDNQSKIITLNLGNYERAEQSRYLESKRNKEKMLTLGMILIYAFLIGTVIYISCCKKTK